MVRRATVANVVNVATGHIEVGPIASSQKSIPPETSMR